MTIDLIWTGAKWYSDKVSLACLIDRWSGQVCALKSDGHTVVRP